MGGGELDQHSLCRKEHDDSGDYGCLSGPLADAANAGNAAARHGSHCSDRRVRRSGSCAGCSSLCALDRDIHVPVAHPRFACSTELADVIRARPGGRLLSGRITLHRAGGPQETGDGGWRDVRHVSNRFRRPAARCIASDDLFHAVDDYARTSRTAWLNVATRTIPMGACPHAVQAERLGLVLCELVSAPRGTAFRTSESVWFASKLLARIMDGAAPLPIVEADSRMPLPPPAAANR